MPIFFRQVFSFYTVFVVLFLLFFVSYFLAFIHNINFISNNAAMYFQVLQQNLQLDLLTVYLHSRSLQTDSRSPIIPSVLKCDPCDKLRSVLSKSNSCQNRNFQAEDQSGVFLPKIFFSIKFFKIFFRMLKCMFEISMLK